MQTQRRGSEQVGLDGNAITIAAGHLDDGFDAPIEQQLGHRARVHRHSRAGRFSHVDRIDGATQQLGRRKQLRQVDSLGRSQFAGYDELAGGQFGREA